MKNPTRATEAHQSPLLIRALLEAGVRSAPCQEIVNAEVGRYTYRDLEQRVRKLAQGLSSIGIEEGQTVAVMEWDSTRFLEAYFAVPMMGATLHTINIRLSPDQLLYTINHAADDAILVNADILPLLMKITDRIEHPPKLVLLQDNPDPQSSSLPSGFTTEYETLLSAQDGNFTLPPLDENAIASTFYTTGTTGNPKGVYFSHRQIVLHALGAVATFGTLDDAFRVHRRDVYMPLTPMFHVHAWGFPYFMTMLGAKQVYPGRYIPSKLVRLLVRDRVTLSHCVPTVVRMVLGDPSAQEADFSRLKMVIGGAAMTESTVKLAQEFGIQVFTGYGMSETCPMLTVSDMSHVAPGDFSAAANRARMTTGKPAAFVEVRVVDKDMQDVPHDGRATGEVVARAPWLTQGYAGDQEGSDRL